MHGGSAVIDVYFIMGITGMLCILGGFLLIQTHRVTADSSGLLVLYGISGSAWPFVILNGVFAVYSLYDIVKDYQGPRTSKIRKA